MPDTLALRHGEYVHRKMHNQAAGQGRDLESDKNVPHRLKKDRYNWYKDPGFFLKFFKMRKMERVIRIFAVSTRLREKHASSIVDKKGAVGIRRNRFVFIVICMWCDIL